MPGAKPCKHVPGLCTGASSGLEPTFGSPRKGDGLSAERHLLEPTDLAGVGRAFDNSEASIGSSRCHSASAASKAVRVDLTFSSSAHARRLTTCWALALTTAARIGPLVELAIWSDVSRTRTAYLDSNSARSLHAARCAVVAASRTRPTCPTCSMTVPLTALASAAAGERVRRACLCPLVGSAPGTSAAHSDPKPPATLGIAAVLGDALLELVGQACGHSRFDFQGRD